MSLRKLMEQERNIMRKSSFHIEATLRVAQQRLRMMRNQLLWIQEKLIQFQLKKLLRKQREDTKEKLQRTSRMSLCQKELIQMNLRKKQLKKQLFWQNLKLLKMMNSMCTSPLFLDLNTESQNHSKQKSKNWMILRSLKLMMLSRFHRIINFYHVSGF